MALGEEKRKMRERNANIKNQFEFYDLDKSMQRAYVWLTCKCVSVHMRLCIQFFCTLCSHLGSLINYLMGCTSTYDLVCK